MNYLSLRKWLRLLTSAWSCCLSCFASSFSRRASSRSFFIPFAAPLKCDICLAIMIFSLPFNANGSNLFGSTMRFSDKIQNEFCLALCFEKTNPVRIMDLPTYFFAALVLDTKFAICRFSITSLNQSAVKLLSRCISWYRLVHGDRCPLNYIHRRILQSS